MAKSKISKKRLTITKTLSTINMDYCDERNITEWIERFTALRDTVDKDGHKYERVTVYWDYDRWSDHQDWMVVTGYREETDDEYNLRMETELEERKRVNLEKRKEKKAREEKERKEYERLKAKFGE